jgi:hypothetical protein
MAIIIKHVGIYWPPGIIDQKIEIQSLSMIAET